MNQENENQLKQLLFDHFNVDELRGLASELGIDYDSLPGQDREEKATQLVVHLSMRNKLPELANLLYEARPDIGWTLIVDLLEAEEPPEEAVVLDQAIAFWQLLKTQFEAEALKTLLFILGFEHDALSSENEQEQAQAVVAHLSSQNCFSQLLTMLARLRPDVMWEPTVRALSDTTLLSDEDVSSDDGDEATAVALWQVLATHFNSEEVRTIVVALGFEYEVLAGESKRDKVKDVVALIEEQHRLAALLDVLYRLRSDIDWSLVVAWLVDGPDLAAVEETTVGQSAIAQEPQTAVVGYPNEGDDLLAPVESSIKAVPSFEVAFMTTESPTSINENETIDQRSLFTEEIDVVWPPVVDTPPEQVLDEGEGVAATAGIALVDDVYAAVDMPPLVTEAAPSMRQEESEPEADQEEAVALWQMLDMHFNREEIKDLAFVLQISYHELPNDETQSKVKALETALKQQNRLHELIDVVRRIRPEANWPLIAAPIVEPPLLVEEPEQAVTDVTTGVESTTHVPLFFSEEREPDIVVLPPDGEAIIEAQPLAAEKPQEDDVALWQMLDIHFNDKELKELAFVLEIYYDDLLGEGTAGKAKALEAHLQQQNRLSELIDVVHRLRPHVNWPFMAEPADDVLLLPAEPLMPADLNETAVPVKSIDKVAAEESVPEDVQSLTVVAPRDVMVPVIDVSDKGLGRGVGQVLKSTTFITYVAVSMTMVVVTMLTGFTVSRMLSLWGVATLLANIITLFMAMGVGLLGIWYMASIVQTERHNGDSFIIDKLREEERALFAHMDDNVATVLGERVAVRGKSLLADNEKAQIDKQS